MSLEAHTPQGEEAMKIIKVVVILAGLCLIGFGILMLILSFRPTGIFGIARRTKF